MADETVAAEVGVGDDIGFEFETDVVFERFATKPDDPEFVFVPPEPGEDEEDQAVLKTYAEAVAKNKALKAAHDLEVKAHAACPEFELGYLPKEVPDRYRFAEAASQLTKEGEPWSKRAERSIDLILETFQAWRGCSPAVMHFLVPKRTSESWVEKKTAQLEAAGSDGFEFSPAKLKDLCMKSHRFVTIALGTAMRCTFEVETEEVVEGNASSSGGSTEVPEGQTASSTTSATGQ